MKGKYELLNSDDHKNILAKSGKDISSYRPDITHQCLMMLLDSPLNKAGKLLVYVHTMNNVIEGGSGGSIFAFLVGLMVRL